MTAALLPEVFTQKLAGYGIQQPYMRGVPLHLNVPTDPAGRRTVVGRFHFHAAIQMHNCWTLRSCFPVHWI